MLDREGIYMALGNNRAAIGVYWIGYSSCGNHASFQPKYCGKAVMQSLYARLKQHVRSSSNQMIRKHLSSRDDQLPKLWFRFVELPTLQLAELLEGMEIAAFKEDYWNARNEWDSTGLWKKTTHTGNRSEYEVLKTSPLLRFGAGLFMVVLPNLTLSRHFNENSTAQKPEGLLPRIAENGPESEREPVLCDNQAIYSAKVL